MDAADQNTHIVVAVVAGGLVMLLLVLIAGVIMFWPIIRSGIRFLGNFEQLSARRVDGKIAISGGLDDWRDTERKPEARPFDAHETRDMSDLIDNKTETR